MTGETPDRVDFLIITALDIETDAAKYFLQDTFTTEHDTLGSVVAEDSVTRYSVAIVEIGDQGKDAAQGIAADAITRLNPRRVIMTGIAAGFPESNVGLGDVLAPYSIVNYELAKIREDEGHLNYEHRDDPVPVSLSMWHAANTLAHDTNSGWWQTIQAPRPDSTATPPRIHSRSKSVLGSGDKLVATEVAEARAWLIARFKQRAIGLEMESFGVLTACRVNDKPFLLIKGCQDTATTAKDAPAEKDKWRLYAAAAAAAFTTAYIRRAQLHDRPELVSSHIDNVIREADAFKAAAPQPRFDFTISRAESYVRLKQGIHDSQGQPPLVLIPTDSSPTNALHGGGGMGKTRIVRSLLRPLVDDGFCPVLIDLKQYSKRRGVDTPVSSDALIDDILVNTVPRLDRKEVEELATVSQLAVIVDGLNEITKEARTILMSFLVRLHTEGHCYSIVTDRFGPPDSIETFTHAVVDRLTPTFVQRVFDSDLGRGAFAQLTSKEQKIYTRPFFLSLALRYQRRFKGSRISDIFEDFFGEQIKLSSQDLAIVAKATFKTVDAGQFNAAKFKAMLNPQVYSALVHNEVLDKEEKGFEHDLWRDFLLSKHLASLTKNRWTESLFDRVTTFSYSVDCLRLALEQLPAKTRRDDFLKAVYDWSYVAAADCIAGVKEEEQETPSASNSIKTAIIAAIAEKRFDRVQRTRHRASDILTAHNSDKIAEAFAQASTSDEVIALVKGFDGPERWFKTWQQLFTSAGKPQQAVQFISSRDSLLGWTAANLARRSRLKLNKQRELRKMYQKAVGVEKLNSVRWRIVHVLGMYPNDSNANCLLGALKEDGYHWVQYGAARSLMEIAASSRGNLRRRILSRLQEFLYEYDPPYLWMRRQLTRELIESAIIRHPKLGWKQAALPVLSSAIQKESDPNDQQQLQTRLDSFKDYNEAE